MEPSGRNRWQPVANAAAAKRLKNAKTVVAGCDRLPRKRHGKEGVSGSSPEEGLRQNPCQWVCSVVWGGVPEARGYETGAHLGIGEHSRACVTSR
jgi:hypothetical protein